MYCPQCAKKIRPGDKFCANCAAPVSFLFEQEAANDVKKDKAPENPKAIFKKPYAIHIIIAATAIVIVAAVLITFTATKNIDDKATTAKTEKEQADEMPESDNAVTKPTEITVDDADSDDNVETEDTEQNESMVEAKATAVTEEVSSVSSTGTFAVDEIKLYDNTGEVIAEGKSSFDSERNFTSTGLFNNDGVLVQLVETIVDEKGHLLYSKTVTGNATVELKYDSHKNITYQNIDGRTTVFKYDYDEDGRMTSQQIYDGSGQLIERKEGLPDQDGKIVRWDHYSSAGSLTGWSDVVYSSDGMTEKTFSYNNAGQLCQETERSYDDENNLRKVKSMSYETMLYSKTYYDENGCIIKTESYVNDKRDPSYQKQEFTYREEDLKCDNPQGEIPVL